MKTLTIIHQFSEESLGLGIAVAEIAGIDIPASIMKFSEMVCDAIYKEYPHSSVRVSCYPHDKTDVQIDPDAGDIAKWLDCNTSESPWHWNGEDEQEIRENVKMIASDVWAAWDWLIYEREDEK